MAITGGSFEFEERVTTGDYQHKAARAIVQFDDPKDIDAARDLAMQQVRTSLGVVIVPKTEVVDHKHRLTKNKSLPQIVTEVKAEIDANPGAPVNFPESDEPEGPKFYTDAELLEACRGKQREGTDKTRILKLIHQHAGLGKSVANLDRDGDARENFMAALGAL